MSPPEPFRSVGPAEAGRLLAEGRVHVLDVRTPEEYALRGHLPQAVLLPLDRIASAPAVLPRDGRPVLVHCEHGIRSVQAAHWLSRAGLPVLNLAGGLAHWTGPREFGPADPVAAGRVSGPSSWLLANADLLPPASALLDVACGRGRHALLLAAAGHRVRAVDQDAEAVAELAEVAGRLGLDLRAEVTDLEAGVDLGRESWDVIVGFRYLHRPLFPALATALRPGGLLLYETFTVDQAARGRPTDPRFLLHHGELPRLVAPLEVVRAREGEFEGRMVSAVAAVKPGRRPAQDGKATGRRASRTRS